MVQLSVSATRVTAALLTAVVVLQTLNIVGQLSRHALGHGALLGLIDLFYVDREGNVPAWYSSLALLLCAVLLAVVAAEERQRGGRWVRRWTGLAVIFALLALDEAVSLHELSIAPLRAALGGTGLLYWTWIVAGAAFAVVVFAAYLPLLAALPHETAARLLVAGAVFLTGALGVEAVSGVHMERHGTLTATSAVLVTIEESLEMLGVVLFARALLMHLGQRAARLEVTFVAGATADAAERAATAAASTRPCA